MSGTEGRGSGVGEERVVRIAAVADTHFDGKGPGALRDLFAEMNRSADVLAICGDMTTHGRPDEMRGFVEELGAVEIPILAVLGNHDHEADAAAENTAILRARGVHVLDGDHIVVEGIGFVGTKGFAGGFGRGALAPFGEPLIKAFVQAAIDESIKLENGLRSLGTDTRVVLLHYSPIVQTLGGEPDVIQPFLGSSRLAQPLDTLGASVIFHGHAHHGSAEGRTPGGIHVFNVAQSVLRESGHEFLLWTAPAPERRGRGEAGIEVRAAVHHHSAAGGSRRDERQP